MQSKPEIDKAHHRANGEGLDEVTQAIKQGFNMSNSKALTIGSTSVRQMGELYALNDLHKAAGGEAKHQPGYFMRRDETQALVAELEKSPDVASSENSANSQSYKTKEGRGGGTYACKELVIAYAAWISAAFHLKVIRVFLAQMPQLTASRNPAIDYDRISPAQAQDLKEIVEAIVKAGVQGFGETWARLQRKFKVNSYHELPATRHLEAREYLIAKLPKGDAAEVVNETPTPKPSLDDAVRLDLAFTLASQTAAKVQQAVFNSVMSGNADWKQSRYLLNLDIEGRDQEVVARARQVESNACVAPIDRFHTVIEDSITVDAQTLTQLASTCMTRLSRMAQRAMPATTNAIGVAA